MRSLSKICLGSLIVLKIVLGMILFCQTGTGLDTSYLEQSALASEPNTEIEKSEKNLADASEAEKVDMGFLAKRKAELDRQEEELVKKREDLIAIQQEINNKIDQLSRLRKEITTEISSKRTFEEQRFKKIIKAYSTMKPQKAASLIERLDFDFAIQLLSQMKGDEVGNILSFLDVEKAAQISEKLATLQ